MYVNPAIFKLIPVHSWCLQVNINNKKEIRKLKIGLNWKLFPAS